MKITKLIGLDDLDEVLRSSYYHRKRSELFVISDIITSKQISQKEIFWSKNMLLLPSVNIINLYTAEGKVAMENEYTNQLYCPECYFVINEIMYRTVSYDLDFFIACSADEAEYDYIKYIGYFINEVYDVKCLSLKKFLSGKKMKVNQNIKNLYKQICDTREELVKKLEFANINPVSLLIDVNDKKHINKMPEGMRNVILHREGRY